MFLVIFTCLLAQASQPQSTEPRGGPSPATAPDILAGPSETEPATSKLTLVKRAFDGTLEDVGPEADAVAVGMLSLNQEQRHQYDSILSARHLSMDKAVRDHYGLIVELAALQNEHDQEKRM